MNLVRPAAAFGTLDRIAARSTAAVLGWSALRSQALRAHLLATMPAGGDPNAFLAEPIIEAAHGWATAHETFGSLAGTLLSESVVAALDGRDLPDPDGRERYRLPRDRRKRSVRGRLVRRRAQPSGQASSSRAAGRPAAWRGDRRCV